MCRKLIYLIFLGLASVLIPVGATNAFDLNDPDLVGYWSFNEGSGTVAIDLSKNSYDGTLYGGAAWTDGIYQGALHFNGSDAYVGTGQSFLNGLAGFTLAGWVSASNVDVYSSLFGQNDLIEFGFIGGSQVGTWLLGNNWQLVAADYPFEYPSWHHLALVGDATGVVIYIDGQEAASDEGAVSSGSSGFTFNIGSGVFNATGDPFLGEIDDVWVFGRALTQEEIQILMLGSKGYPYASRPEPPDGAIHADTWVSLSWRAGDFAVSHDVYLCDNFNDVNDGTDDTFRGNQTDTFFVAGFPGFPYPDGLVPGTTYYWRIDEVNDLDPNSPWKGDVWSFTVPPRKAYDLYPPDGTYFVDPNVKLTWMAGFGAKLHTVYFGDDFDTVSTATGGAPLGVATYTPGPLELDKDYYWRVDEFDGITTYKGDVLSFRTTIPGLGKVIYETWQNIPGTDLDALKDDPRYPGNPSSVEELTSFGIDEDMDNYGGRIHGWLYAAGTGDYTLWLASDDEGELWLSTDDDPSNAVRIAHEPSWAPYNTFQQKSDPVFLVGGNKYYISALWKEGEGGDNCQVAWQGPGVPTRVVIAGSNLSPYEPVQAFSPNPRDGGTGVTQTPTLSWKSGKYTASHQVYFGADEETVKNATTSSAEYKGSKTLGSESYEPGKLPWVTTYYWRVDEVNNAHPDSPWIGKVWSFTTADFLIVDDFEAYNDLNPEEPGSNRIFLTWIDGYDTPTNGSQVGYTDPPFCEQSIVHGGDQSMPLFYDNSGPANYSEATLPLSETRDWTEEGVGVLTLWFRGNPAGFVETPAGTYTMRASGVDIWDEADEFRYAYKQLSGDGEIIAQVLSVQNTDGWAKAGVMIRETLDAGSKHAFCCITPSNGKSFQNRTVSDQNSWNSNTTGFAAPYWVRLVRQGNAFTAYHSADGVNWELQAANSETANPAMIPMATNVYIGLALTSHNPDATCVAEFSDVRTTGSVSPAIWTDQAIGVAMASNEPESMYVAVANATGPTAVVYHDNPNAVVIEDWTEWNIDLTEISNQGVVLTNVDSFSIGFGDRSNPQLGGSGLMFIDDIRLYRPPPPATSGGN